MSKVDELHNREDSSSLKSAVLFFLGLVLILFTLGIIFWSAF